MSCDKCTYRSCKRQCMDLPEGKTCNDCNNFEWCKKAYSRKSDSTRCDFEPIRFSDKGG